MAQLKFIALSASPYGMDNINENGDICFFPLTP